MKKVHFGVPYIFCKKKKQIPLLDLIDLNCMQQLKSNVKNFTQTDEFINNYSNNYLQ